MVKTIAYKGNTYEIQHERIQERRPNGFVEHVLSLIKANNRTLGKPIIRRWHHDSVALILETKELIDSYVEEKAEYTLTQIFEEWDGNLDN